MYAHLIARPDGDVAVEDQMGVEAVVRLFDLDAAGNFDSLPAMTCGPPVAKKRRKTDLFPGPKSPTLISAPVALSAIVIRLSGHRASANTGGA